MKLHKDLHYLIVMRGLPASGKSTFIEKYLKNIAVIISPDELRIKYNGIITINGIEQISQAHPKQIWNKVFSEIRANLKTANIVVVDATSTKEKSLNQYLKLVKEEGAELIICDFSEIDIEVCKERNRNRLPKYKRVSDDTIDRMYKQLQNKIQGPVKDHIITRKELLDVIL